MVDGLAEEARARHRAHADLACKVLAEFEIALVAEFRDIEHNIISALGVVVHDLEVIEPLQEEILLVRVFGLKSVVVVLTEVETGDDGLLQGRRCADGEEVVDLFRAVDDLRRGDDVAETPGI